MKQILYLFFAVFLMTASTALAQRGGSQPTPVIVYKVMPKTIIDEIQALGTLRANETVDLTSTVTERITDIHFTEGQRVEKDKLLITMDASEEIAEREEQKSNIREAQRQIKRLKPLVNSGAASVATRDEQQRNLETSKARLQAAQARINQRRIYAPFNGVVGIRNVSVGALIQPGTLITTLDDDSIMKLDFSVPEVFLASLASGMKIEAMAKAFPNEIFIGNIQTVDSRIDPITRSVRVRAILKNDQNKLKPGLLMSVKLQKPSRKGLIIPEEALIINGDQYHVFVARKQKEKITTQKRRVEIGTRRIGEVEILSGLKSGDVIITQGTLRISAGSEVKITAIENNDTPLETMIKKKQPSKQSKQGS